MSTPIESPARGIAELAELLAQSGDETGAERARALAERIGQWESDLRQQFGEVLSVHHEVNNALTGVFGNAQHLIMGPAGQDPSVRKRLESLIHEAERIRDVAGRLRDLRRDLAMTDSPAKKPVSAAERRAS
jgi:signal transduction histidine kinase